MHSRPSILRTILNALGTVAFAFFAWLQREDDNPDIYVDPSRVDISLWMAFYGMVACLFAAATIRRRPPGWCFLLVALLGIYHLSGTLPGLLENLRGGLDIAQHSMSPERAEVELSREFFGTLIALAATILIRRQFTNRQPCRETPAGDPTDPNSP
jgi:hypothetical protein